MSRTKPVGKFNWRHGNHNTKGELANWVTQYQTQGGGGLPVLCGLTDRRNLIYKRENRDFLYADHAYFDRGWDKHHFRLIRKAHHLSHIVDRPDDRLKKWKVRIEPWRTGGRDIVVIPPSQFYLELYDLHTWLRNTLRTLGENTDRHIHVKHTKGRLRECLLEEHDAFAVVCAISVAGMEAALMGVPVFSTEHCCSWPVNAGNIKTNLEMPERPDRFKWACSLAYASFHADELERIDWRDFQYSFKDAE